MVLSFDLSVSPLKLIKPIQLKLAVLLVLLAIITGLLTSCTQRLTPANEANPTLAPSDSVFIYLKANNLSEDMSKILSTKNDELLVLIYEHKAEGALLAPLYHKSLVMDADKKEARLFWKTDTASLKQDLLFLLIEQDFDRPLEQLDPTFRIHHTAILEAYRKRDYQAIKKFFGSEDLLGYKVIRAEEAQNPIQFKIEGVHKLDWYEYEVQLQYRFKE